LHPDSSNDTGISFLIGGEAGQGITRSGSLLGKAFVRGGFHIFGMNDYPSIIRGGHNFYVLRVSSLEINSHADKVDLIIALNKETALLHAHELSPGGRIIHDSGIEFEERELDRDDIELYPLPMTEIVKEIGGVSIMRNTVGLGAATAMVEFDIDHLKGVISDAFAGREKIIESNHKAIDMGYNYAEINFEKFSTLKPEGASGDRIMLTGNDAVALGAIQAGCKFFAAYPMTPASPVLHYLISKELETGMVVIQAESEIAAINMTVGAAYAGARSMTATSGGGFCLMTEGFGLAGATETPIVVMLGQRPGPSTGMATYTGQGDLLFALNASQGEFPRVVVAPGDVEECFYCTIEAFNLAEKYQVPAIILNDKYIIESHKSTPTFNIGSVGVDRGELLEAEEWMEEGEYKRFEITETGVSPRIILGTRGATMLANGNEHNEYGYTTIDPVRVVEMADKRFRKKNYLAKEVSGLHPVKIYGTDDPEVTLVGWGSTKGPALEALKLLERDGVRARFVQIVYMEPFPADPLKDALGTGKRVLLETNVTGLLGRLIMEKTCLDFNRVHLKYNGRPFNPGEIASVVKEVLQ
jgi:2-oxoglutarate ferredoxin oxidoreductase subunit alpha